MQNEKGTIFLRIGDKKKAIQEVTEQTTCGDVIKMVLHKPCRATENAYSYFIFECGNGSERVLFNKTKVLKTMRTWGTDKSYHFALKECRGASKIFRENQEKFGQNTAQNNLHISSRIQKATSKLTHFVLSRETKHQKHKSTSNITQFYRKNRSKRRDEIVSNVDQTEMAACPNFRRNIMNERDHLSGISESPKIQEPVPSHGSVYGKEVNGVDKINNVKYVTKRKSKRDPVLHRKVNARMPKKNTLDSENKLPAHSTPTRCALNQELDNDITDTIARMNRKEGKNVILQRYFAEYIFYNSPHADFFLKQKRERGDGASFTAGNPDKGDGSFCTYSPLLMKHYERRHSESDSGQEDHDNEENLDNAFIFETTKHTDSDCVDSQVKCFSDKLVNYDITMTTQMDRLVAYSLNDSSMFESDDSSVDLAERNIFDEDNEMASFMDSNLPDDFSDEGLSSLDSDDEKDLQF